LPVLTGGPRDLPEKQQTLRATIAWSYDLLPPVEQESFARLAVFAGGCTIEAAEELANAELDTVHALVDKSLLSQMNDRVWMLETIREFALERLEESGEAVRLRQRHAESFLSLAEEMGGRLRGQDVRLALDRLAAEHENLRAALEWVLSRGELELEVRLATSLQPFFEARGHFAEGRRWLEAGLRRPDELPADVRANAAYCLGRFAELLHDHRRAAALHAEAVDLFRLTHDCEGLARALIELATAERRQGHLERAEPLTTESVALARTLGDPVLLSDALFGAARMALDRGERPRGRALVEEALTLRRKVADAIGMSVALVTLGWLDLAEGDLGLAADEFDEALALAREVDDIESIAYALDNRGLVALRLSDHTRAANLFVEGLALASAMGDRRLVAECLAGMAAAVATNHPERTARLLGASEGIHQALGTPFNEDEEWILERFVDEARTDVGEDRFSAEWAKGRAMSLDEAVAYAGAARRTSV
jgi:tetratricopeptide (TPR) repeat protein